MATLKLQLEEAKLKIAMQEEDINRLRKVNNANRDLKSDLKVVNNELEKAEQKLRDVHVITNAFISTESELKRVEVGSYRGTPTLEMEATDSRLVKILRAILDATEDIADRGGKKWF